MSEWVLTVGLEIHVELETKTKMFCGCLNDPFNSKPNTHVCTVCYGLPGALPVMNRKAVEMTARLGQALNGKIASRPFWARKNYFYPDLPKGYQISQSTEPLIRDAVLVIDGQPHRIHRIHLEEDAGKLMHDNNGKSLVDYNRAGVPLMEIVTEPDFHSAASAKHFCQELQQVIRHLGLSQADMEKGRMRCEANVSISKEGEELGDKVEVKNINSFRAVEKAIEYEYSRQKSLREKNERVAQETRTWSEKEGKTIVMRRKETSADYRYFPEPDLPFVAVKLSGKEQSALLPEEQRSKLRQLGMPEAIAKSIVERQEFESIISTYQAASNRFKKDEVARKMMIEDGKMRLGFPRLSELSASERVTLLDEKDKRGWTKPTMEKIIEAVLGGGKSVSETVAELSSESVDLSDILKEVVSQQPKAVEDYHQGKEAAFNFLVGQVMAKTKGQANIGLVREELKKTLG